MSLTRSQFRILACVAANPGITNSAIARASDCSPSSVTRYVKLLREDRILTRDEIGQTWTTDEGDRTLELYRRRPAFAALLPKSEVVTAPTPDHTTNLEMPVLLRPVFDHAFLAWRAGQVYSAYMPEGSVPTHLSEREIFEFMGKHAWELVNVVGHMENGQVAKTYYFKRPA